MGIIASIFREAGGVVPGIGKRAALKHMEKLFRIMVFGGEKSGGRIPRGGLL